MANRSISILCMVFLSAFLIAAGCMQGPSTKIPAPTVAAADSQNGSYTSNETLVAFVKDAVMYAKAHGTRQALSEFNNRNGSFVKGELYIYAYAYNGTTLAHPINPEAVGKPREGANGVFVREMGAAVRNGSGFYRFTYVNPQHNNTLESKLGYGVQVADDWWLGSGVYTGPVEITATTSLPAAGTVTTAAEKTR